MVSADTEQEQITDPVLNPSLFTLAANKRCNIIVVEVTGLELPNRPEIMLLVETACVSRFSSPHPSSTLILVQPKRALCAI